MLNRSCWRADSYTQWVRDNLDLAFIVLGWYLIKMISWHKFLAQQDKTSAPKERYTLCKLIVILDIHVELWTDRYTDKKSIEEASPRKNRSGVVT